VNLNNKLYRGIREANALLDGTRGAQFEDMLQPLATEVVVVKKRVSAHFGTELPLLLQTMRATEVVRASLSSYMAPLTVSRTNQSLLHTPSNVTGLSALVSSLQGPLCMAAAAEIPTHAANSVCFAASKVQRVGVGMSS